MNNRYLKNTKNIINLCFDKYLIITSLIFIIAMNVKIFAGFFYLLDPVVNMEPYFIRSSSYEFIRIMQDGINWGPLYKLWFKLISLLNPDAVMMCFYNIYFSSILLTAFMFLFINKITKNSLIAIFSSLFILISAMNIPISGAERFINFLILIGLYYSLFNKDIKYKLNIIALTCFFSSLVRPEFIIASFISILISLSIFIYDFIKRKELNKPSIYSFVFYVVLIGLFYIAYGLPVISQGSQRSFMAFTEFFSMNWFKWGNTASSYQQIIYENFGNANTISEAFFANPKIFTMHIFENVTMLYGSINFALAKHFSLFSAQAYADMTETKIFYVIIFLPMILTIFNDRARKEFIKKYSKTVFIILPIIITQLSISVVIMPNFRYLLPVALFIILISIFCYGCLCQKSLDSKKLAVIYIIMFLLTPAPFKMPANLSNTATLHQEKYVMDIKETIQRATSCNSDKTFTAITFRDGIATYIGKNFNGIHIIHKENIAFDKYLAKNSHINMVIATSDTYYNLSGDNSWADFLINPNNYGFMKIDKDRYKIFIKKELYCY